MRNFLYVERAQTRWCRLRLENTMATCCRIANFAAGKGEDCGECGPQAASLSSVCAQMCVVVRAPEHDQSL